MAESSLEIMGDFSRVLLRYFLLALASFLLAIALLVIPGLIFGSAPAEDLPEFGSSDLLYLAALLVPFIIFHAIALSLAVLIGRPFSAKSRAIL